MGIKSISNNLKMKMLNNVIIKRYNTLNSGEQKQEKSFVEYSSNNLHPIFVTENKVAEELERQKKLISEEICGLNLMHILRLLTETDASKKLITEDNRKYYLPIIHATVDMVRQILPELHRLGYIEIAKKRQKYHDYKVTRKAYDTWNSVLKYSADTYNNITRDRYSDSNERYLLPYDAKHFLEENSPDKIDIRLSNYSLIPYKEKHLAVMGQYQGVDMIDFKDNDFDYDAIDTKDHQLLYKYINAPELGKNIYNLVKEGTSSPSKREVKPKYILDKSIVFVSKNNQHYIIPDEIIKYVYNNYHNEPLSFTVLPSQHSSSYVQNTPDNKPQYYHSRENNNYTNYILKITRKDEEKPLILYRFNQLENKVKTII